MAQGLVFSIQHFSVDDGPGIRSTVFLKGCPLRCRWCHNPEGLSSAPQLQFFERKCVGCGACMRVCPQGAHNLDGGEHTLDFDACTACGACVRACPTGALDIAGIWMEPDEVIEEILPDRDYFIESGGGITVSGGEPLIQIDFLEELLRAARDEGISTAVETSGYARWAYVRRILPLVDQFLWDYKLTSSREHEVMTGVGNERIMDNLRLAVKAGANVVLRCPIVPGVNDTPSHFRGIACVLDELPGLKGYELMPYHRLGLSKAVRYGLPLQEEFRVPAKSEATGWQEAIESSRRKSGVRAIAK